MDGDGEGVDEGGGMVDSFVQLGGGDGSEEVHVPGDLIVLVRKLDIILTANNPSNQ